ncbi:MAG: hypothetical protein J7J80_03845 [Thermotogae bacterium]|nr:hypothetical protein [Thermotogota bacterium]
MLVIKSSNVMAVFSDMGEMDGTLRPEEGVYLLDTKVVEKLRIRVNPDKQSVQISKEAGSDYLRIWELSGFDGDEYEMLVEKVFRTSPNGVKVEIDVRNLKDKPVVFLLESVIDYTCTDIFEIRQAIFHGVPFEVKDSLKQIKVTSNGIDCVSNFLEIHAHHNCPENLKETLGERQNWKGAFEITAELSFQTGSSFARIFQSRSLPKLSLQTQSRGELRRLLKQSVDDLNLLLLSTEFGAVPAAGTPWFSTIFGRDSLIFSIQCLDRFPELVRNILKVLSFLQARRSDSSKEMEFGKILHEMRTGELNLSGQLPFALYYGTIDATPLYLLTMHAYWKTTGDHEFVAAHAENILKAFQWIHQHGDLDGDGYLEYQSRSALRNQGWKDSSRSVVRKDGSLPKGPIALAEVQAYLYGAINAMIDFERHFHLGLDISKLRDQALNLKVRFNRDFWLEDEEYFALALDGEKHAVDSVTSNPAHGLLTGIIEKEKAEKLVRRLFSKDMFSGWGVRTMSNKMKAYNPFSYHNGSVWPHDNSLIIKGLLRYGYVKEAKKLARALLNAAKFFDYRLPELYSGLESPRPLPYPVSCSPQLWAAGSAFVIADALEKY